MTDGQGWTTTSAQTIRVFADRRWPSLTGIGKVQAEFEARKPADIEIVDLCVAGKIGSPLSPLMVSLSLLRRAGLRRGVFFSAGFIPPVLSARRTVLIVHDLTHRMFYGKIKRLYYDWVLRFLYRRCDAVICVSSFVRDEFIAWSGMDPARVHVIYNGCETSFSSEGERFDPGYPYLLYCGNHRSYKNLDRLIRAYAASRLPASGIRLAITGSRNADLAALAASLSVEDSVTFLGRVPDDDLPGVYRGAKGIVYVSLFEGFGLPILEAFASGVPIMTSNVSSMPEVAGGAALIVDPYCVDAIRDGLERLVYDKALAEALVIKGRERLKDFDWDTSAAKLWALVRDVSQRGIAKI